MSPESRFADPYDVLTPGQRKAVQTFNSRTILETYDAYMGKDSTFLSPECRLNMMLQGTGGIFSSQLRVDTNSAGMVVSVNYDLRDGYVYPVCQNQVSFTHRETRPNEPQVLVISSRLYSSHDFEGIGLGTGVIRLTDRVIPNAIRLLKLYERYDIIVAEKTDTSCSFNPLVTRDRDGVRWTTAMLTQLGYQPAGNFPNLLAMKAINLGTLVKRW